MFIIFFYLAFPRSDTTMRQYRTTVTPKTFARVPSEVLPEYPPVPFVPFGLEKKEEK